MSTHLHSLIRHYAAAALVAAALWPLAALPAAATKIERLVTPGGIEVWLVRDATVPLIALDFGLRGGAAQEMAGKGGTANMLASLLDEGAGDIDGKTFHERLERKAIELTFTANRDSIRGTMRTLKENRDEAFDLLRLALTQPRFEAEAVERIRSQIIARLQRQSTNPNTIASLAWWEAAFPDHPYARQVSGTLESVPRIGVDDLKSYLRRVFARETLKIGVVGDIDAASVATLIDRTFGGLPAKAELLPVPEVTLRGTGRRIVIDLDVPQTVITFGAPGVARGDPDFMAAYVMNHIFGGGSFSSRLYVEVREKRGLAYGVNASLYWLSGAAAVLGGSATRGDAAKETIEVIEAEAAKMAKDGPTAAEFDKAKTYLKGAFALGLDTSTKIASQLVTMQLDNLGIDYIDRRSALIDSVTLADAKRVASRILGSGLLMTVVGRPKDVAPKG